MRPYKVKTSHKFRTATNQITKKDKQRENIPLLVFFLFLGQINDVVIPCDFGELVLGVNL